MLETKVLDSMYTGNIALYIECHGQYSPLSTGTLHCGDKHKAELTPPVSAG